MAQTRTVASRNKNNILSGVKFINTVENEKINLKDEVILSNLKELKNKLNKLLMEQVPPVETAPSFECKLCFEDFSAEIGKCVFTNCCNVKLCIGCYGKSIASQGKKLYEQQSPDCALCCPFCTRHMVKSVEMKDSNGRFLNNAHDENATNSEYQGAYVLPQRHYRDPNSVVESDSSVNALYPTTSNSLFLADFHRASSHDINMLNDNDENDIPELVSDFGENESTIAPNDSLDSDDEDDSGSIPVNDGSVEGLHSVTTRPEHQLSWIIDRMGDPEVRRLLALQAESYGDRLAGLAPNAPLRVQTVGDNHARWRRISMIGFGRNGVRQPHRFVNFSNVTSRSEERESRRVREFEENVSLIMEHTHHAYSRSVVLRVLSNNNGDVINTIMELND